MLVTTGALPYLIAWGSYSPSYLMRLYEYLNTLSLINETQAGFRHGYSTLDHIFLLKCVIDLFIWKKRKLFCLFVDHKKAFDIVWREGL